MFLVKLKQKKSFAGKRERRKRPENVQKGAGKTAGKRAIIGGTGARMEGRRHSINKAERGGERGIWRICGKMGKKYGRIS